jgi:hypothetical protein
VLAVGSAHLAAATDTVVAPALPYSLLGAPWTVLMLVFWVVVAVVALYGGSIWKHLRNAVWLGWLPGNLGALPTEQRPSHDRPGGFKVARIVADPVTGEASFLGLTLGGLYDQDSAAGCEVLSGALPPPRRWGRRTPPPAHAAPDLGCTCGFYALADRSAAAELLATRPPVSRMFGAVLLEVDLAGTVIEFDHGYRAGHQRVLGVQVPRWCLPCARLGRTVPARRIAGLAGDSLERACRSDLPQHPPLYRFAMAVHNVEVVRRLDGRAALRPVCDDHTPAPPPATQAENHAEAAKDAKTPNDATAATPSTVVLELADLAAGLGTEVRWLDDDEFDVERFVETVSWPPPPRDSLAV